MFAQETRDDARYLERARQAVERLGVPARVRLLYGDPVVQIPKAAEEENVDLLIRGSHGHRLIGDIFFGSTVEPVCHRVKIPVLVVRAD